MATSRTGSGPGIFFVPEFPVTFTPPQNGKPTSIAQFRGMTKPCRLAPSSPGTGMLQCSLIADRALALRVQAFGQTPEDRHGRHLVRNLEPTDRHRPLRPGDPARPD